MKYTGLTQVSKALKDNQKELIFHTDGFHNKRACGYVIATGEKFKIREFPPDKFTSNECEYLGILDVCLNCENDTTIFSDSKLVVEQTTNHWRVKKKHLEFYVSKIKDLIKAKNISIQWVPRDLNLAGVFIEKKFKV